MWRSFEISRFKKKMPTKKRRFLPIRRDSEWTFLVSGFCRSQKIATPMNYKNSTYSDSLSYPLTILCILVVCDDMVESVVLFGNIDEKSCIWIFVEINKIEPRILHRNGNRQFIVVCVCYLFFRRITTSNRNQFVQNLQALRLLNKNFRRFWMKQHSTSSEL
jgi:hypothetical protein